MQKICMLEKYENGYVGTSNGGEESTAQQNVEKNVDGFWNYSKMCAQGSGATHLIKKIKGICINISYRIQVVGVQIFTA